MPFLLLVAAAEDETTTTTMAMEIAEEVNLNEDEDSKCDYPNVYVNGQCVDMCIKLKKCGDFTSCETLGATYCKCLRGYSGNPLDGCFKLNETSPCEPNICGPHSDCIENDAEIGPHCKCSEDFYGWPPNCRTGCKNNDDCGQTEICNSQNSCVNMCESKTCGENANCRVDKKRSSVHCSCKDGFTPKSGVGCEPKSADEQELPLDFIGDVITDPCEGKCGHFAYCDEAKECVCTQGYGGNATSSCSLIELENRVDACTPNPCGGYSTCSVVNNEKMCLCIEGYGTAPYCSRCNKPGSCGQGFLCVGGRCIANVCESLCGISAGCNIYNETLECSCEKAVDNSYNQPFVFCPQFAFIPPSVIATLLG